MASPWVSEVGVVTDLDGAPVRVGVDHDAVMIAGHPLAVADLTRLRELIDAAEVGAAIQKGQLDDGA